MSTPLSPDVAASIFLTPMRQPRKEQAATPKMSDRIIPTPVGNVAVWQQGDGPVVLLVHGWSGTHTDLDSFVAPLLAAGRRVISIDLPAHGLSDGKLASLPDMAKGVVHVANAIGPISGVIAHSIGCAATGLALQDGMKAARVVLIAPPSRYTDFARAFARQAGIEPEALLTAIRKRGIDIDSVDYPAIAPALTSGALVIHSKDDQVVSFDNGMEIAAAWPDAQFIACDGLGHRRILTDPGAISEAVRFLTD
jgi:pimeloyl-ACP methyl ester carboxylesterase